jgi:anti-anti-sigma regulatory factor
MEFGAPQIAVDLSETVFIDASGLDALIAAYRSLGQPNGLVIRDPSGRSRRLLDIPAHDSG